MTLQVNVASIPEPAYQWYKEGKLITGATKPVFTIKNTVKEDEGDYQVEVKNNQGSIKSGIIELKIKN